MQIIIPMSGFGERFKKAGYQVPKPLILVENKTIIQHVCEMFPGESNFTFICNKDHLSDETYDMEEIIRSFCPSAKIHAIEPHNLGPVHAVMQCIDFVDDHEPTIVNYCDFTCDWSFESFKNFVQREDLDGAIPAYKGFHPHTLWSNYYAYLDIKNNFVSCIQEKTPFTDTPQDEYASSGTYYFKSGELMKKYFQKTIDLDLSVNQEFYVSMVYEPMIENGLKIKPFEIPHFMQWGTPRDLQDYEYWSEVFKSQRPVDSNMPGTLLMPMAGMGSRFQDEGYLMPKPLIEVDETAMAIRAYSDLPSAEQNLVIIRNDQEHVGSLLQSMQGSFTDIDFYTLHEPTEGQAVTCALALKEIELPQSLVTISACDNGVIYDSSKLISALNDDFDILIWGARGYPGAFRSPEMYGWLDVDDDNKILGVSVKKPFDKPESDPIITGTFIFKNKETYLLAYESLLARNGKVNGEYYVDSMIHDALALDLKCKIFEVTSYICWGTPNDLKTYEYWQTCLKNWPSHPYQKEGKS